MDSLTSNSDLYPQTNLPNSSNSDEEVILASSLPVKKRAGRTKFKETRHPIYRGVRQRNSDRWVCEVREPTNQKRIWLGTYPTAEMAARAYDVATLALRGQTACLNFADSVWRLPVPQSIDPKDLRRAAVEAAEAFWPTAEGEGEEGRIDDEHTGGSCTQNVMPEDYGVFGWNESNAQNVVPADYGVFGWNEGVDLGQAADGVLMSPPPNYEVRFGWDDVESDAEVELWSY
ncbi:hypothetical protein BUALT_Bualt05G0062300 [Buddleja alternifolia]|uniref:AP2/ERF domain-containing protein n=1 Tax=Buddleja alternifolia TaxID=168488 RepID=A0AAV6XT56_9LAMI|nr:hypothetical protein BUALT_Bualt05G0062300 [Buddleja alternifolia]